MKTALKVLTFAALLSLPVSAFARDYDRGRPVRSRVAENFEREHPRWPRVYCHTHRYPLHRDDTREHCHNWNRDSWQEARQRWGGGAGTRMTGAMTASGAIDMRAPAFVIAGRTAIVTSQPGARKYFLTS